MRNSQPYGCRFEPHSFHNFFYALMAFFCLTWVQIRKFTNFKVQKHHDSQELSIPDYGHLDGYFMENILAYANSTPRIALKMPLFYSKTKHF